MTKYEKTLWNNARNRWYALSLILGESTEETKVINIAMQAGFCSTDAMRTYFLKWGDKMVKTYGKLPYRMLNSKSYIKYMELMN